MIGKILNEMAQDVKHVLVFCTITLVVVIAEILDGISERVHEIMRD